MAKITIFGLAGTGTSTLGRALAQSLDFEFLSPGILFRRKADELSMSLPEFEELVNQNPEYDFELDAEIKKFGETHNNFVVEGRLAWFFIPDSIKIKLVCDFDERVRRVASRDHIPFEEAKNITNFREESGEKRYEERYEIKPEDYAPDHIFDLIVDTTKNDAEMTLEQTLQLLAERGLAQAAPHLSAI